jgi:hypothetical protein
MTNSKVIIFVTEAGGSLLSAFFSYKTRPVDASIRNTLGAFKSSSNADTGIMTDNNANKIKNTTVLRIISDVYFFIHSPPALYFIINYAAASEFMQIGFDLSVNQQKKEAYSRMLRYYNYPAVVSPETASVNPSVVDDESPSPKSSHSDLYGCDFNVVGGLSPGSLE